MFYESGRSYFYPPPLCAAKKKRHQHTKSQARPNKYHGQTDPPGTFWPLARHRLHFWQARGVRLGATQRKLPLEHFVLLNVLGALELLVFPLLGAGISGYEADAASPGHVLWVQSLVFALLAGGVVLALQVVQDLRSPTCGLYSLDETLEEMVEGLRAETHRRVAQ
ncbi:unnamed protein product, partial [Effrenium voratum]